MADIDNGDILRIGATWEYEHAYEVSNVFHARVTAGGGIDYSVSLSDIQEYMADIYTEIDTYLSDEMRVNFLTMSNITQDTTIGAFAWAGVTAGQSTGERLPPGLCCMTWARTLKPRVQIRKYWGVFDENRLEEGVWDSALQVACELAMGNHIAEFAGTGGLTVQGVAYNRTLTTFTEGVTVQSAAEPAYQRRRKRGRGS